MSDTVLYALVIYCIGCVIPTPLDRAPLHPNVGGPVFVTSSPAFGKIGPFQQGEAFELSITVTDPDVGQADSLDEIHARLYRQLQGADTWDGEDITLMAATPPDPNMPQLRFGTFPSVARCSNFGIMSATTDLFVKVSDRAFKPSSPLDPNGGLTDTNHWELACN